jgi:hypothetical protein
MAQLVFMLATGMLPRFFTGTERSFVKSRLWWAQQPEEAVQHRTAVLSKRKKIRIIHSLYYFSTAGKFSSRKKRTRFHEELTPL